MTSRSEPAETVRERLFTLRDVTVVRGERTVLQDVTLDLPADTVTALIGPSGAGKTTLLRLLNRLDEPTAGSIAFAGRPLASYAVRELRRLVGFVFQRPTMFPGTVADNLRAGLDVHAGTTARAASPPTRAELERVLALVELGPDYLDRAASALSGGEQQRVSIGRALMLRPTALLLDEPTSALDPEVAERFTSTVARLSREHGLGVVMVTHRLTEAASASSFTVMLDGGRVVEAGATKVLFEHAAHERTRTYLLAGR